MDSKISQYLFIVDERNIYVKNDVELPKYEHRVFFELKDKNGNAISGAEITCKKEYSNREKTASGNEIKFEGEELNSQWIVSAKKGDLITQPVSFKPENQTSAVLLVLQKQKVIKIFAIDKETGNQITNFKLWINNGQVFRENITELIFKNDDIEKTWTIEISKKEGQDSYLGKIEYCPYTGKDPLYVQLQKTTEQPKCNTTYKIDAGEHGKKSYTCPDYSNSISGNDLDKNCIIPNKDYSLKKWELKDDTIVAQYEKKESFITKPKFVVGLIIGAIFLSMVILGFFLLLRHYNLRQDSKSAIADKIAAYIEGIELNKETLEGYKQQYCVATPNATVDVPEKSLWQKIWPFGSKNNEKSKQESFFLPDFCSELDDAIAIRKAINHGKIDELKGKNYSEKQQNFKQAIDKLDDKYKNQIGDTLKSRKVSLMNLNEVADLIKKVNNEIKLMEQINQQQPVQQRQSQQQQQDQHQGNSQQQLQQRQETQTPTQQKYQAESSLEKEFWELVHSGNNMKDKYDALLKKHKSKGGDIITYLNRICKNSTSFRKFKDIPEMDRKSAKTLTEIDIE
jgi:hypothetical protein